MGSIGGHAYDSELGDTYMRLRREYHKAGKQGHWRPAVTRDEQLMADEVNRRVRSTIIGYAPETDMALYGSSSAMRARLHGRCAKCGQKMKPGTARLWRQIWADGSGRVDLWCHSGSCPERPQEVKNRVRAS